MPKDVGCEGADESSEQCCKEWMIAGPPLDHLPGRWLLQQQAGDIEGTHPEDQDRPANGDQQQTGHPKSVPGRCHSQRPAIKAPTMNTSRVQSRSLALMHKVRDVMAGS